MDAAQKPDLLNPEEPPKGEDLNLHAETNGSHVIQAEEFLIPPKEQVSVIHPEGTDTAIAIAEARRKLEIQEPTSDELDWLVGIVEPSGDGASAATLRQSWETKVSPDTRQALGELRVVLENKERVLKEIHQRKQIFDKTIELNQGIIDAASPWTADHSLRVTLGTYVLAQDSGDLSDEYLRLVYQAGIVHDAGKVGIRESTLNKPGFPTEEERRELDSHVVIGYNLVAPFLGEDVAAGQAHHEGWNGLGYINKLVGHETPLLARQMKMADIWDALRSSRPYKQGKTPEASMRILEEETQGWIKKDRDTGELSLQAVGNHDPLITAQFGAMYEGRRLRSKYYFRPAELEAQVKEKLSQADPYTEERIAKYIGKDEADIEALIWGDEYKEGDLDLLDLDFYLRDLDIEKVAALKERIEAESQSLSKVLEGVNQVATNASFLLVNSVEARYLAYKGVSTEVQSARQKIDNRVWFALLLAQQMGLSEEEQKKVIRAAEFAVVGTLSVPQAEITSQEELGIKGFSAFLRVPEKGTEILQKFMSPGTAEYFEGADLGARDLYKWYDGKGGYGVGDPKPSLIGHIVAISNKWVAMRSENPHRKYGMTMEQTMEEMRKGVGTEFDPEVFRFWEQLFIQDELRAYIPRREVVDIIRSASEEGAEIKQITLDTPEAKYLAAIADNITEAKTPREKLRLCLEGAKYAKARSLHNEMERFIDIAQNIAIELGDAGVVGEMIRLYDYDLHASLDSTLSQINEHLEKGGFDEVMKAKRSLVILIMDFAEKQQTVDPEVVGGLIDRIRSAYANTTDDLLARYKAAVVNNDSENLKKFSAQIDRAVLDLEDKNFTAQVEVVKREASEERAKLVVGLKLDELESMLQADLLPDPLSAEHLLASAKRDLRLKGEGLPEIVKSELEERMVVLEKNMREKGYLAIFQKLRKSALDGEAKVAEELVLELYRWMKGLEEGIDTIEQERIERVLEQARRKGVRRMIEFLQAEDLGLEDIALVERWRKNAFEWQDKLDDIQVGEDRLAAMAHSAFMRIMDQLKDELPTWTDGASEGELKGLLIMLREYISESKSSAFPQDRKDEAREYEKQVGELIYQAFMARAGEMVNAGEEKKLVTEVGFFETFCSERGEVRIALSDKQKDELHQLKVLSYSKALDIHIENIANAKHARVERFRAEVRDLEHIWQQLVALEDPAVAMADTYEAGLNEAIKRNFAGALSSAIQSKDYRALSAHILNLLDISKQDWATEDVERGASQVRPLTIEPQVIINDQIRALSVDTLMEGAKIFATQGDLQGYLDSKRSLEFLKGYELGEEWDRVAAREFLKRAELKVKLLGSKSLIYDVRSEEDKATDLLAQLNLGFEATSVQQNAEEAADKIVESYRFLRRAYVAGGGLLSYQKKTNEKALNGIIVRLKTTNIGIKDAKILEEILASEEI